MALRLIETRGRTVEAVVRSGLGAVSELHAADLLETELPDNGAGRQTATLHGYQIRTQLTRLDMPRLLDAGCAALAAEAETCQPLYARYWLHNRGPAPLGGLPVVAHLHPHRVTATGTDLALRLTVASDCIDSALNVAVTLVCPPGWSTDPTEQSFPLGPGGHAETSVAVTVPERVDPGVYPIRAQLRVGGDHLPPAWRQVVEDVCLVSIGVPDDGELIQLIEGPAEVDVAAGGAARLAVTVGSKAHADLAVEAHLISPWGTWEWMGPATAGAVLPARGAVQLEFEVTPPAWAQPGQWWALIRVACAGELVYSPAVRVTVRMNVAATC
jgi:alpha-mannosidase